MPEKIKAQVISGDFNKLLARQKSDEKMELGELLVADMPNYKILLQVFDLVYGSQISQQNLELISGYSLEDNKDLEFMEPQLRNYILAWLKTLITIKGNDVLISKQLPDFFSGLREINKDDISFLSKPKDPLFIGFLRSGSKILPFPVYLDGSKVLSHHVLIAGTTGKGKSIFISNLLWDLLKHDYSGILILDPHDEYFGRNKTGLKDHPNKEKVVYYSTNAPLGQKTLKINIELIKPQHFEGVIDFSDAQRQALNIYYKQFGKKWIEAIIIEKKLEGILFRDDTIAVVRRRILYILDLEFINNTLKCKGVFDLNSGSSVISDITSELENGKVVIIDTSNFSGAAEILIGSLICNEIFNLYRYYKNIGILGDKPVISVILEEAPRVLGKEVLDKSGNIFSSIAREGRKFKVGIMAITQLPSLIPRDILANMNSKIILGIEMKPERQAIIESASHDLSDSDRTIASLDIGEALVSSNFAKLALPIKIPFFEDLIKEDLNKEKKFQKLGFDGVNLS